jgi:hypothetical protein
MTSGLEAGLDETAVSGRARERLGSLPASWEKDANTACHVLVLVLEQ